MFLCLKVSQCFWTVRFAIVTARHRQHGIPIAPSAGMLSRILTLLILGLTIAVGIATKADPPKVRVPDFKTIPPLSKDLPAGTIAWALINQEHPSQPQTGHWEVKRKFKIFRDLYKKADGKFPQELYERMYREFIVPGYLGPVKRTDKRYGKTDSLFYLDDRTHTSFGDAMAIEKTYGVKALSTPLFDDEGRPLNFILVKVIENKSDMTFRKFADFMTDNDHAYLQYWSEAKDGGTSIRRISFNDVPDQVYETTDNPFRSLVSWAQEKGIIGRSTSDFAQFVDAEIIVKNTKIGWGEIDDTASKKELKKARKRLRKFIESDSEEVRSMPGMDARRQNAAKCDSLVGGISGP
jgi:hypothetical protein